MKKRVLLLFLLLLTLSTTAWASDTQLALHDDNLAIHTYGGGALFEKVFNAISLLIYGNAKTGIGKTFHALIRVALTIGGFSAICMTLFREKMDHLVRNFFLPGLAIVSCLLLPRTTVYIKDHLAEKTPSTQAIAFTKVSNVPFVLGKFVTLTSTLSYYFTNALESVAHETNDPIYERTGHIFAGENLLFAKKCRISHPVVEDNFREFCRECVFRDLGIGVYSKNELIHSDNILKFLEEHTSNIRTVYYKNMTEDAEGTSLSGDGEFIPCREAIKRMNALFDGRSANTKEILVGEIGNEFSFLLKEKNNGEKALGNLIKQQIAIDVLKEEVPGTLSSFSSRRAELLQRTTQKVLGAIGSTTLLAILNYFQALVYMSFPLILLFSLFSFGIKQLINWTHFVLWINIWPPFYVVVKFLLSGIWTLGSKMRFGDSFSLTISSSEGFLELYNSMEGIAAISIALIPFLSWILIKGQVSQMVHLASSIMSPAQSAASTVSSEQVYGNYSYGNVNKDNISAYNSSSFRQSSSGAFSQGSISIDSGMQTTTYVPSQDELFIRQGDSYLREGISKNRAFSGALQESFTTSEAAMHEASKTASESLTDSTNRAVGLVQGISRQHQSGENFNKQTSSGVQEAHQYIQGLAGDYAASHGISQDQALREVLSAGLGVSFGLKGGVDASYQDGTSKSHSDNILEKAFDSGAFQKHLQTLVNSSSSELGGVLYGEDAKLHSDFARSYNDTASAVDQWRAAYSRHETFSNLKTYSENENVSIQQNLNQRFVEFLKEKHHGDIEKINQILELPNENPLKEQTVNEFVSDFLPHKMGDIRPRDLQNTYQGYVQELPNQENTYSKDAAELVKSGEQQIGKSFGQVPREVEAFKRQIDQEQKIYGDALQSEKMKTVDEYRSKRANIERSVERSPGEVFWNEATSLSFLRASLKKGVSTMSTAMPWSHKQYQELYGNNQPIQTQDEK